MKPLRRTTAWLNVRQRLMGRKFCRKQARRETRFCSSEAPSASADVVEFLPGMRAEKRCRKQARRERAVLQFCGAKRKR